MYSFEITMVKKVSKIPEFKTVEEEAFFWDAHSPSDFPDEWEDVTDKVQFSFKRTNYILLQKLHKL